MATAIYQCPETQTLFMAVPDAFTRIRPQEYFAIDDADTELIADLLEQGFDIGDFDDVSEGVSAGNPNHIHPHNPHDFDPIADD